MSPAQAHDLIERLYDEHRDAVLRFTRSRNRELADDVVSETFAIALRRADVVPEGAERAWLIGVADNVLRGLLRKERRAAELPNVLEPHTAVTTQPHELPEVGPALSNLPDTERAVLTLTAFEGLSSAEAAERLGMSAGSTRNAMVRARRNLRLQLAAFGILLLVPVLYFVLRDRETGGAAPQAQQLADALRRAETVTTDALVTSGSADPQRYRVTVDRAAGTQRVTLPGGAVATGALDEPARVQPQPGVSPEERRRVARTNAPALRALQTISSGDLERFLAQARRAGVTAQTRGTGDSQVTILDGPFTTADGRRVELHVVLGGEPAELRQLRVRPIGRDKAPWTTVDISGWQVDVPGGAPRTVPGSAAAPRSEPKASAAPKGPAKTPITSASERDSRSRSSSSTTPAAKRINRDTAESNRATFDAVSRYAGTTGPVIHTRGVTTIHLLDQPPGKVMPTKHHSERWLELGGGERVRELSWSINDRTGGAERMLETWSSPRVWAMVPIERDHRDASTVSIFCRPNEGGRRVLSPAEEALQRGRAALDTLPAGPEIDGRATKTVRHVDAPVGGAPAGDPPVTVFSVDAETGVPLRQTFEPAGADRISSQTDFELWEERPAGGSARELAGTPPERFRLRSRATCGTGAKPSPATR